jgi:hypothetical protein
MAKVRPLDFERARREKKPQDTQMDPLFKAMADARGEYPEIPKTRTATVKMKDGRQYSYDYADLADVVRAVNPVLSAFGLNFWQWPEGNDLITEITHESGRSKQFKWPIKAMPKRTLDDAMSHQSSMQVVKRYALLSALGISAEETHEGDHSRKRGMPKGINENFETEDGVRHPKGAKFTSAMTPREKAEEAARAIVGQFDDVKTQVGVNGVWSRNETFIAALQERYPDLYDNVFDTFHKYMEDYA